MLVAAYYLCLVAALSCTSFAIYGWDKQQAIHARRRVSEQTLHLFDLFGGWPGGLLGQRYFRHKTKQLSFQIRFWLTVLLHLGIVGAFGYENFSGSTEVFQLNQPLDVDSHSMIPQPK